MSSTREKHIPSFFGPEVGYAEPGKLVPFIHLQWPDKVAYALRGDHENSNRPLAEQQSRDKQEASGRLAQATAHEQSRFVSLDQPPVGKRLGFSKL
jgi:hypothetical protein